MERVIIGRFRNSEQATEAVNEVKARHLSLVEPVLVKSDTPYIQLDSSASIRNQQRRLDKFAAIAGLIFLIIGTVGMILLGHAGRALVHLPTVVALWGMTVCYAMWETYQVLRISRAQQLVGDLHSDVIITTDDPIAVEDMLTDAGADEVAIRAA
jgi:hypothetical protein